MTSREKYLASAVGIVLVGAATVGVVKTLIIGPLNSLDEKINAQREKIADYDAEKVLLRRIESDWKDLTRRTLARSPQQAERVFREDMHQLLEKHGLGNPKVSPGSYIPYRNGAVGVPLNINASGTLNQIVGFLRDFYRRDYLARLEKVRLTADSAVISQVNSNRRRSRPGRRGGRDHDALGPNGPELRVTISATTLVLPELKEVDGFPIMEEIVELDEGRLRHPIDEYELIYEKSLFTPYQEPRTVVHSPDPRPTPEPDSTPVERTPVNRRPHANEKYVRGIHLLPDGEYFAQVYNDRASADPVERVYLDDEVDDGRLILIHRHGIVVRTDQDGEITDWFYPLGTSFADREKLDPDLHPQVWNALEALYGPEAVAPAASAAGARS